MRVYLLRIISFLHYYTLYRKLKINNDFSFFKLLENLKNESSSISLETLNTLKGITPDSENDQENLTETEFNKYFIEYNKINKYNNKYNIKIRSYKIKVLRKIKNLKKFFFYNNKRNKGLRIFAYLNTFSIKFHLKHLL